MSQAATAWRGAVLAALTAAAVTAQIPGSTQATHGGLNWRHLGRSSIDLHLAGPATGPISSVWYSSDGGSLFVRTASGRALQTADFETWIKSEAVRPETPAASAPESLPESPAKVIAASGDSRRAWALGRDLFVSEDSGATWESVSGTGAPVIGTGQNDVAVNPREPMELAVANSSGVWQSQDGGRSWAGLNENLPNLPIARILSTRRGAFKIALDDGRALELSDTHQPWTVASGDNALAAEARDRQRLNRALGAEITATARSGEYAYAGSSDGRVWVSRDRGVSWNPSQTVGVGSVERFYVDAEAPRAAIAVLSGSSARLARTVDSGAVWDDVTGNLPDGAVHAVAADRASGSVAAATDSGVYLAHIDLNVFTPGSAWTPITGTLPAAKAVDVAFDSGGDQLYVAMEGFGLYTAPVPVRSGVMRLTNAADFSNRPAAPGSVISVLGAKVTAATGGSLRFPVLAAGDSESQLQVPFEASGGSFDLAVRAGSQTTTLPLAVRSVSPAIFVDRDGSPFLVDADTGLTLDAAALAHPRAHLELMATGLGRVQPDWPTGVAAPAENTPVVVAGVQAYLDGIPLEVTKSTLAPGYVGYYLVEVQLPAVLNAGPAELYLVADGQPSNKVHVQVDSQ